MTAKKCLADYPIEVDRVSDSFINKHGMKYKSGFEMQSKLLDYLGDSKINDKKSISVLESRIMDKIGITKAAFEKIKKQGRIERVAITAYEYPIAAKVKGKIVYVRQDVVLHKKQKNVREFRQVVYRDRKGRFAAVVKKNQKV